MKHIQWLPVFFASLTFAMLNAALAAESEDRRTDTTHRSPKDAAPGSALPAQATFERIANETGGTYIFEPNGSAEDYRNHFQKMLETMIEENNRGEGQ
jgi:hypothetical protein